MYLTLTYPSLLPYVRELKLGLRAINLASDPILIIKAPKEIILTARVCRFFKIYVAKTDYDHVLISAFFDDHDEPLLFLTPLIEQDELSVEILKFLLNENFSVSFFDENNREYFCCKAKADLKAIFAKVDTGRLMSAEHIFKALEQAEVWFSYRDKSDDKASIEVSLTENLMPDDIVIMDLNPNNHASFADMKFTLTSLIRESNPGFYQEADIVLILNKVFKPEQVLLNPTRPNDGRELTDILVVGSNSLLLIQAKDSEHNKKQVLETTIERKRKKSISQLKDAAQQLNGALSYLRGLSIAKLKVGDTFLDIDISKKQLIGVLIVKELFNDMYNEYSEIALGLMYESRIPVVFFDYPELAKMAYHCNSEDSLLNAIHQIFVFARDEEIYPRLRYKEPPVR